MQNKSMDRRRFLTLMGTAALGGAAGSTGFLTSPAMASSGPITYSGSDLAGWEVVLGDGLWTAAGQPTVNSYDIQTTHHGPSSLLEANRHSRGVMAHNITFKRLVDMTALQHSHVVRYKFRSPYVPSTAGSPLNAQTIEGGFFIWDGANSQLDYGVAFQWILNPWMSTFGELRTWGSNSSWVSSGHYLPVDTAWHEVVITLDPASQSTSLQIDATQIPAVYSQTPKNGWGSEVAARLQAEIISIWPGQNQTGPRHEAEFKDWQWEWHDLSGS